MTIERRRPRTSRRLFGDRERIEVLEARQLLTHLSGASVRTVQPSVVTATIAPQVSTAGPYRATPAVTGAQGGSAPVAPTATVYGVSPNPAYPMVSEAHATFRHGRVTAFVVSFTHDMAPGAATDLANYEVTETSRGLPNSAVAIPLSAATYDPVHRAVTLIPAQPMPVGHFSIEGPGSQGKTTLTDVNGVSIDSGQGGPTPNAELFAAIKRHGRWFGPANAEEVARRTIASLMKRSGSSAWKNQAAEFAGIAIGTIISPFVRH
jgi:hypothetical protein